MSFRHIKYLAILSGPLFAALSFILSGWGSYALVIYVFGFVPVLELFAPASEENMTKAEEEAAKKDPVFDWLLWMIVPIQFGLLFWFLSIVSTQSLTTFELIGKIMSMGIACGVFGINVAHELGHRTTKHEQWMAKALLLSSMYMHFIIEHNRGHHKHVSTDEDPASSKMNEALYPFWIRSVTGSYVSAWKLEHELLDRKGIPHLSFQNEMIQFNLIQVLFCLGILFIFGFWPLIYFLFAATIGFLLLETVNYIEHYGLRRVQKESGKWSQVLPIHSWNSNHAIGRMLLFELTRHSDHHYKASRKYQILRHFDEAPQMPYGYPMMLLLSFFPPVFFRIMNKQIEEYKSNHPEAALS